MSLSSSSYFMRALLDKERRREELAPRLVRVNVEFPGLDRRLDGLRIGQISDVHVGSAAGVSHLQTAARLLAPDPPDLLAVTGDLVDDARWAKACFEILTTLKAPYGRYFIMGNHDNEAGRAEVLSVARRQDGFTALIDEELDVTVQGARFHISGIDFPATYNKWRWSSAFDPSSIERATKGIAGADFRLCLSHHPDNFDALAARGIELTLSGHTHGGQIVPVGRFLADRIFKYVRGLYRQRASALYVTAGTGHWFPLRIGVPAEVTELTLRRADPRPDVLAPDANFAL